MKKLSLLFLVAILLPILVLSYLGYNTFAKRREAVKNLLASSLWVSAEAALRSIEESLLEDESNALRPENFSRLVDAEDNAVALERCSFQGTRVHGKLFLVDRSFQILVPKVTREEPEFFPWPASSAGGPFQNSLARAESLEFSGKAYSQAADIYRKSAALASSRRERAVALEGLGRSLLLSRRYDAAIDAYRELVAKYSDKENRAGHPFAIIARLQLSEIERQKGGDENCAAILFELYQKMRNGTWPVNQTLYEFFAAEIDSRLSPLRDQGRLAEIRASMEELRGQSSPHLKALIFTDLLRTEALTEIRRKVATLPTIGAGQKGRFVVGSGNDVTLISFSVLPEFKNQGTCLGGFYWEPGSLKEGALPQILDAISHDSGLRLQLIGESGRDVITGEGRAVFTNTVTLPFGRLPFPWKLVASQLARHDLEREVRRDNVLYGVFLAVIVTLMFLGAILILRDISREKETTRQRSEFVNNISHEFKTPLTLIRLYSETLERQEDLSREEKNEAYEIITKEAERLTHMINNVLDFSRIEMGRKEFNFKSGDLPEIIRTTLNSYRYHLEKKGFLIHAEIAADVPPMEFDEEAIAGVLINLLNNATKFSSDRKEVTVRLFQKGANIVFQVEDKGIGISAKESGRIFEKFYQVKNEGLTEAGGSGLGLSLVKHVIEAHGGEVQVESEPGKGSAFSVILPVERPASRGK